MKEFQVVHVWYDHEEFEAAMQQNFVDGWEAVAFFCIPEPHPVMEAGIHYVAYMTREPKPTETLLLAAEEMVSA